MKNNDITPVVAGVVMTKELDFNIKNPIEDTLYAVDFMIKNIEFYKPYVLEFKTLIDNFDIKICQFGANYRYQEILDNIEFKEGMCEEKYNSLLEAMYKCKNSILSKDIETFTRTIEQSRNLVKTLEMFFDLSFNFPEMTGYYQFVNNIFQCAINNVVGCFVYFYDYYESGFKEEMEIKDNAEVKNNVKDNAESN